MLDRALLEAVLAQFLGTIQQVPPMYSALKKDGRPLYELARQGISVARPARPVQIHALSLLERARGSTDQGAQRSLPELVQAYELMSRQVVESLARISETAMQLERRHEQVRENLKALAIVSKLSPPITNRIDAIFAPGSNSDGE